MYGNVDHLGEVLGARFVVESVMIPGFVDADLPSRQARAYPSFVALGDGEKYLVIEPTEVGDGLRARVSRELSMPGELPDEPSIEPLYLDTANILIDEVLPVEITSIDAFSDHFNDTCPTRGIRVTFANGRVIGVCVPASSGLIIGGADVTDAIDGVEVRVY